MKRTAFAIFILLVIIAMGVGEQIALKNLFADLDAQSKEILRQIGTQDMTSAMKKTQDMQDWWEDRKHLLEAVVSHNETKEVTIRIAELKGYIAIGDHKSAYATAEILNEMSRNLPHLLGFSWDTVC